MAGRQHLPQLRQRQWRRESTASVTLVSPAEESTPAYPRGSSLVELPWPSRHPAMDQGPYRGRL